MKKILMLVVGLLFILGGCSSNTSGANDSEVYTLKIGHTMAPSYSVAKGYVKLKEVAEELSDGRLEIQIYDSGTMGKSDNENLDAVTSGTLDMASTSNQNFTAYDPIFNITTLPHFITSDEDWKRLWDSEIGNEMKESIESKGFKLLMFSKYGFRNAASVNTSLKIPEDIAGLKSRTTTSSLEIKTMEQAGVNPVPMGWAEVYTALKQGTLDAEVNALPLMTSAKHHEVLKHVVLNKWAYTNMMLLMNLEKYNSLPDDLKDILHQAIEEAEKYDTKLAKQSFKEAIQTFEDAGATVYEPTEAEMEKWIKQSKVFWKDNLDLVGEDFLKRAYETVHGEKLAFE